MEKSFERIGDSYGVNESDIFSKFAKLFSNKSALKTSNHLSLLSQNDEEDLEEIDQPEYFQKEPLQPSSFVSNSAFAKKIKQNVYKPETPEEEETIEMQMQSSLQKLDLNQIINSGRLMRLKLDMEKFPDQELGLEDFIIVMKECINGKIQIDEEVLISDLVDQFHRIDIHGTGKINFDMFSSFLIEQEIMAEMGNERALLYKPSELTDNSRHDNYIDKMFYYPAIDKLGVMEQNMRALKIYNPSTLKLENCLFVKNGIAIASEYIPEYEKLILTSSDKSMLVFDLGSFALEKRIVTPESQHTMHWSHSHQVLFSAGMDGKIYGWLIQKLLNYKEQEVPYSEVLAKGMPWSERTECIFYIVELTGMEQIAAASADQKIRLWDIKWEGNKKPKKVLCGHTKAVRYLAYSQRYNLLVSCGFEFDALVWNPYVSIPICQLKGHEAPLCGIECPEANPTIITADSKGIVKVWNIKDYSLLQTFYVSNFVHLKAIKCIPKHRKLLAASRRLQVYEYDKPFVPELSDDSPIFCARYSSQQFQVFIAGQHSIKVWNALTGRPMKFIADIFSSEITCMILDETERKIVVGDHSGRILMIDSLTGVVLKEFCSHNAEVTGLIYVEKDRTLISCSWDKKVLIHNDNLREGKEEKRSGVVRTVANAHTSDIICVDYSGELDMFVTGSSDCSAKVWDYETCKLEGILLGHKSDILVAKFLRPFPLLLLSDQSGNLSIWGVNCSGLAKFQCLVKWKNMHTLEKTATITSASYVYQKDTLQLVLGDEKGTVRVLDLTELVLELDLTVEVSTPRNAEHRNPTRLVDVDMAEITTKHTHDRRNSLSSINSGEPKSSNEVEFESKPLKEDFYVKQKVQWKAHSDSIKYIAVVQELENLALFSTGLDKMAYLWSFEGQLLGTLKQGSRVNSEWSFRISESTQSKKKQEVTRFQKKLQKTGQKKTFGSGIMDERKSVFQDLITNLNDKNPKELTASEMIEDINKIEKLLPKDRLYETMRDSRTFRPKKSKKQS